MDYQLIPAVGTTDADGITTFTNRPPGAPPLFYKDGTGSWVPVGEASPATPASPGQGTTSTYTAGPGIDISAANEISTTDYTDAEVDALLTPKLSKQEADTRYGRLLASNVWEDSNTFRRYAEFASTYLPLKVTVSAFGIVLEGGGPTVTLDTRSVQFTDGTNVGKLQLLNGILTLSGGQATEVAQEPTTPLGIATKSYVDRMAGSGGGSGGGGGGVTPAQLAAVATTLPLTPTHTADYTLQLSDIGALVPASGSNPVVFTVPPGLGNAAPGAGTVGAARVCYPVQLSSGQLTLFAGSGVNLVYPPGGGPLAPGAGGRLILTWLDLNTVLVEGGI